LVTKINGLAGRSGESKYLSLAGPLHSLAGLYTSMHRYYQAEETYRRSLATKRASPESNHLSLVAARHSLGNICRQRGKYVEAPAISARYAMPAKPEVAHAINGLAMLNFEEGRKDEAIEQFERAAQLIEQTLGSAHPQLAVVLLNQAELPRAMGRKKDAKRCEERAHAIRETRELENHLDKTRDAKR
jgi:tetratricopeptide (TPR) repeat protein